MSAEATLTTGYVRRGLSPDAGGSWFLPRLIGQARAVWAADAFASRVDAYAAQLASGPPIAFALAKRLLLASADATLDQQLREELTHIKRCFATADVREAMAAFKEKRAPVFRGE